MPAIEDSQDKHTMFMARQPLLHVSQVSTYILNLSRSLDTHSYSYMHTHERKTIEKITVTITSLA